MVAGASKFVLLLVLVSVLVVACLGEEPTSTPRPSLTPTAAAKSNISMVFTEEPTRLGVWGSLDVSGDLLTRPGCPVIPVHTICQDMATDVLTYVDSSTLEVVPLSGVQAWEQIAEDRWRFYLTPGVKFHNGEEWNAEAARIGIDIQGHEYIGQASHGYTGTVVGEVIDNLIVDVVCEAACPIFPRTAFFIGFQAPEWWSYASLVERTEKTIGFGPYVQVEHRRGRHIKLEKYDKYVPNS